MKNKKSIAALAIITSLSLAACGDTTDNGDDKEVDEITAWAWDQQFNIRALEIAEDYQKEEDSDFSVEIIENAQDDIVQSLNTNLSSGVDQGLPNIVLIEDYRAPSFLNSYPDYFYPLTEYYNQEDFSDYKVAAGTLDGEVYGIPFDSGVTGLYVRTDLLEEAGYSVDDLVDITWDEYIEIGKDVYKETDTKWITSDPSDLGLIRTMIQSSGTWYTKEDGVTPYIADNEPLKIAFENYKEISDAGLLNLHNDWDQLVSAINGGVVATSPTGNWFTISIKQEESQKGDWAVVPYPRQDYQGSVNASNLGGSSLYVLNIEGKEQAAEFLANTFGSNNDFYQDLVEEIGAVGTYGPAKSGEGYAIEDEYFSGQQIYRDFAEWTEDIPVVEFGQNTYAIEDILAVALQDYLDGKDLDATLEDAQKEAESQL